MELICICCPLGCRMNVEKTENGWAVSGNTCKRGEAYAIAEMTAPERMVTSSVKIEGGDCAMLSVKTDKPIAKNLIFDALNLLKTVTAVAPVKIGDVILENVLNTGVNFVSSRNVDFLGDEK